MTIAAIQTGQRIAQQQVIIGEPQLTMRILIAGASLSFVIISQPAPSH